MKKKWEIQLFITRSDFFFLENHFVITTALNANFPFANENRLTRGTLFFSDFYLFHTDLDAAHKRKSLHSLGCLTSIKINVLKLRQYHNSHCEFFALTHITLKSGAWSGKNKKPSFACQPHMLFTTMYITPYRNIDDWWLSHDFLMSTCFIMGVDMRPSRPFQIH